MVVQKCESLGARSNVSVGSIQHLSFTTIYNIRNILYSMIDGTRDLSIGSRSPIDFWGLACVICVIA